MKQLLSVQTKEVIASGRYSNEILSHERYRVMDAGTVREGSKVYYLLLMPEYADREFCDDYRAATGESFSPVLLDLSKGRITSIVNQEKNTPQRYSFDADAIARSRPKSGDVLDITVDLGDASLKVYRNKEVLYAETRAEQPAITSKFRAQQVVKKHREKLKGLFTENGPLSLLPGQRKVSVDALDRNGHITTLTLPEGLYAWERIPESEVSDAFDIVVYPEGEPYHVSSKHFCMPAQDYEKDELEP